VPAAQQHEGAEVLLWYVIRRLNFLERLKVVQMLACVGTFFPSESMVTCISTDEIDLMFSCIRPNSELILYTARDCLFFGGGSSCWRKRVLLNAKDAGLIALAAKKIAGRLNFKTIFFVFWLAVCPGRLWQVQGAVVLQHVVQSAYACFRSPSIM
jgi:hypothetical protein